MSNAISGFAGISGATVSYTGTASGSVTADSFGNYSIGGLSAGSYTLVASLSGYTFSGSQTETISGSDITGVNFTASFTVGTYTADILGSDSAQRANESPLNSAYWTKPSGLDSLAIVS